MEGLTRLVDESLARHGFDPSLDYRRLHWSRWFRCDSPHSLLFVPSKPGVFAIAEEVAAFCGASEPRSRNPERSEGSPVRESTPGEAAAPVRPAQLPALAAGAELSANNKDGDGFNARRMLAVLQFCEDDDMAFVLDRMFSRQSPMRARLATGRCFIRFVVIGDTVQRRSICGALNQWLISSGERASGIGAHFATSLELAPATEDVADVGRTPAKADIATRLQGSSPSQHENRPIVVPPVPDPNLRSGARANMHCPQPFPSGF